MKYNDENTQRTRYVALDVFFTDNPCGYLALAVALDVFFTDNPCGYLIFCSTKHPCGACCCPTADTCVRKGGIRDLSRIPQYIYNSYAIGGNPIQTGV